MRIACLQFSPQVGDIDNNLNRADAVLNKAKPEELEALDLLVLPEMAFSGYKFKSLHQIHPFLEPSGSGISSLWARTTALKFNTKVIVGYPEKVDVREKWPASPEYYNSAIMVNGEGENILNYRKRFLHRTDETWALEGDGGFYSDDIVGLGKTVVGICMDLNPYRFESPWNAFEFGSHALEIQPDLIIVNMSWVTRQDSRDFSRMLAEPDMETLTYWVQRLEPVISAEFDKEIIVVFCNRCGQEGDALYAGTSAIIGIKGGEVNVYALAGRGTKEFLMADTSNPPFAKLIQSTDNVPNVDGAGNSDTSKKSPGLTKWPPSPPSAPVRIPTISTITASNILPANSIALPRGGTPQPKQQRPCPKIQIPNFGSHSFSNGSNSRTGTVPESPITIPTPEAPSPTPLALRPKLIIPETSSSFGEFRKASPFPHDDFLSQQFRFFGTHHQPATPVAPSEDPAQARYYWRPSDTLLNPPVNLNWASSPESENAPAVNDLGPLTPYPGSDIPTLSRTAKHNAVAKDAARGKSAMSGRPESSPEHSRTLANSSSTGTPTNSGSDNRQTIADSLEISRKAALPHRASSRNQRSASGSRNGSRSSTKGHRHGNNSPSREWGSSPVDRAVSVGDPRTSWMDNVKAIERSAQPRPESPKSRHTSRNRSRTGSTSREHAYGRRPLETPVNGMSSSRTRARSGSSRPPSRRGRTSQDEIIRPASRGMNLQKVAGDDGRSRALSATKHAHEKSSPEMAGITLPKLAMRAQSPGGRFDETRPVSRGRQRWLAREPPPPYSETPPATQPPAQTHVRIQVQAQNNGTPPVHRHVSITRIQSASGLAGVRFATPDDEIIAIEEYDDPVSNLNSRRAASANALNTRIPSIEDGRAIVGMLANLPPPPPVSALDETDDFKDSDACVLRTPSVLGGSVKTTIVEVPHSRTESGVSVLSPPLSGRSEMMSPTSPSTDIGSDSDTPLSPRFHLTPRAMALTSFVSAAERADTPFPPQACTHCDHGRGRPVVEPWKPGLREIVEPVAAELTKETQLLTPMAADTLTKRRSW